MKTVLIPGLSAVVTHHTGPPKSDTERQRQLSKKLRGPADWYILKLLYTSSKGKEPAREKLDNITDMEHSDYSVTELDQLILY